MLIAALLVTLSPTARGEKVGVFQNDYFKIPVLRVDDHKVYVVDKGLLKGFIYERKALKKIAEFGNPGSGPVEFNRISGAYIDENYIYVTGYPKLCIFSKEGKFIKEFRVPIKTGDYIPLGNNTYIGTYTTLSPKKETRVMDIYRLFDGNIKLKREFFSSEYNRPTEFVKGMTIRYLFSDCVYAAVYKNNIYIGNTDKGFYFAVFNREGGKLYEIKRNIEKRIITQEAKDKIISTLKSVDPIRWKNYSQTTKIAIRDEMPAYKAFFVADDRIYVFSYPKNKGMYEIFMLDLKGNILKKKQMSIFDLTDVDSSMHCIDKGKLFFIKENEGLFDDDTELHEVTIFQ